MSYTNKGSAQARAKHVQSLMTSKGWKIRVWENMGWHWSLNKGWITLSEGFGTFSTLASSDCGVGEVYLDVIKNDFKDPNTAVEAQLSMMEKLANTILAGVKASQ